MQFAPDFWDVYDDAQKRLAQDPEFTAVGETIESTLEKFRQQELLERLTDALQVQTLMLANEIYQLARFRQDRAEPTV